jgi:hypothetical protein
MVKGFRALLGAFLALAGLSAFGQSVTSTEAFGAFKATVLGQNTTSVTFGSNGTPLATATPTLAQPDGGAGFKVSSSGSFNNPAGNKVVLSGVGRVSNAEAAAAIGRFIGRSAGTIFAVVTTAVSIKLLLNDLGYGTKVMPDGTVGITKPLAYACTSGTCYNWIGQDAVTASSNPDTSCSLMVGWLQGKAPNSSFSRGAIVLRVGDSPPRYNCPISENGNAPLQWIIRTDGTRTPDNPATAVQSAPLSELTDAIANRAGWPVTSNIAKAAAEAKVGLQAMPQVSDPVKAKEDMAPLNVSEPLLSGPATSPGRVTKQVSNNPDGSQREEEVTCYYKHAYAGSQVTTTEQCDTVTTNDGASGVTKTSTKTDSAPVQSPTPTTTTVTGTPATPASAPQVETCGLPNKPACKIDEAGTPPAETLDGDAKATEKLKDLKDFATNPVSKLPTFPTLNWSFRLPSGCTAVSLPAFAPYLQEIDICQFMPLFHDLMSVVWVMGALFGVVSMFWRSTMSAN